MFDTLSKVCAYGTFEALMEDHRIPDAIYIGMVQMHMQSLYNLSFCEYFYLCEKNIHKHKNMLTMVDTCQSFKVTHNW